MAYVTSYRVKIMTQVFRIRLQGLPKESNFGVLRMAKFLLSREFFPEWRFRMRRIPAVKGIFNKNVSIHLLSNISKCVDLRKGVCA